MGPKIDKYINITVTRVFEPIDQQDNFNINKDTQYVFSLKKMSKKKSQNSREKTKKPQYFWKFATCPSFAEQPCFQRRNSNVLHSTTKDKRAVG